MELHFTSNQYPTLNKTFHDIKLQEETGDIIIPDTYPDAASIADCFAQVYLRNKECGNNSALISGGIRAGILYTPEDHTDPRLLELYLPFSIRFDSPELTDESQLIAVLKICSVDGKMVNSRKMIVRVTVGCEVTAYRDDMIRTYELTDSDPRLQCRKREITFQLPVEIGEKHMLVSDTLDLSSDRPPIVQICKSTCIPVITDKKLIGDKGVFKGDLHCKLLYFSDNNKLYVLQHRIPFSQYCELRKEYDNEELMASPICTSFDAVVENNNTTSSVQFTADILIQCMVTAQYRFSVIDDAYCVGADLKPEWKEFSVDGRLDHVNSTMLLRHELQGNMEETIDAELYTGFSGWKRSEADAESSVPVCIRACGYDEEGNVVSISSKSEMKCQYPLSQQASCMMDVWPLEYATVQDTPRGAEVRCNYGSTAVFSCLQSMPCLCGGTLETQTSAGGRMPSLIMKTVEQDLALWDIGKKYGTSVASLKHANQLEGEITTGGMLLIPID